VLMLMLVYYSLVLRGDMIAARDRIDALLPQPSAEKDTTKVTNVHPNEDSLRTLKCF